jgi:cyclohexyl-isocyanide hydratase
MASESNDAHAGPWPTIAAGPNETGMPRPVVGMLLYPGLTLLDLIGPQTVLWGPTTVHLIAKTRDLVVSDTGVGIRPTMTFAEAPARLDVLFVPGGPGQVDVIDDPQTLAFLADRGAHARYVTAVCTGSIILGAAGLLKGYKATTHWAAQPLLPILGAEAVSARVVIDRNRITGGGVTAGIDFGLTLLAQLCGEDIAKLTQLAMEYDPKPPFDAGSPGVAGPELVERVLRLLGPVAERTIRVVEKLTGQV